MPDETPPSDPNSNPQPRRRRARASHPSGRKAFRPWKPPAKLTQDEIESAFDGVDWFPPVLTADQAAKLLQIKKSTLYKAVSEGRFKSATRRGKPLRFWRDRLLIDFFSGE